MLPILVEPRRELARVAVREGQEHDVVAGQGLRVRLAEDPVGERVADELGARGGKQHEGVAIALLPAIIGGAVIVDGPEIAAALGVAVEVPEVGHAVIDDRVGARPTE